MRYIDKFGHHKEALEKNILYLKSIYSRNITSPDPSPADGKRSYKSFKRFKRQCARNGVLQEVRKREHYEKPSVKKKKKSEAARKRKF